MSVQNFVGDAFNGATWVALHNGGGTGWGEAMNGGFGLVLDGSEDAAVRAERMLFWDVNTMKILQSTRYGCLAVPKRF